MMSNMDLLMGILALLSFVFIGLPMLGSAFAPNDGYLANIKLGFAVCVAVILVVFMCAAILIPFIYFTGDLDSGPIFELSKYIDGL